MPRPGRPGQSQTTRSKSGGGGSGLMDALSAMLGGSGTSGGTFTPASSGEGSQDIPAGISGVEGKPIPASISPVTVNHPLVDALTGGRAQQFASQANLQTALQQLTGVQGLDQTAAEGANQQAAINATGANQRQNISLQAKSDQDLATLRSQLAQKEAITTARNAWMKVQNMAPTDENFATADAAVTPHVINALQTQAQNEGIINSGTQDTLKSPVGQKAIKAQTLDQLGQIGARNKNLTKMSVGLNDIGVEEASPFDGSLTIRGPSSSGSTTTNSRQVDLQHPGSYTDTTKTNNNISPGFVSSPVPEDPSDYPNWLRGKTLGNGTGIGNPNPSQPLGPSSPVPSGPLGNSPSDPSLFMQPGGIDPNTGIGGQSSNPASQIQSWIKNALGANGHFGVKPDGSYGWVSTAVQ